MKSPIAKQFCVIGLAVMASLLLIPVIGAESAGLCLLLGAVTASQFITRQGVDRGTGKVAESTVLYGGTLAFTNASGYTDDDVASGVNLFAGIVVDTVDNSTGANGALNVNLHTCGRFLLTGSGFAQTSVGLKAYASDNFTISLNPTSKTYIGTITNYVSSTQVLVQIDPHVGDTALDAIYIPSAVQQALSGAGACNVTSFYTAWTTTGAQAGTLANGTRVGQLKKIQLIVDGGDGTLTPVSLGTGTTITFADAGDYWIGRWNGTAWITIEVGNDADGATAPVIA